MRMEEVRSMTAVQFHHYVRAWGEERDLIMAESMRIPGPRWNEVLVKLRDEAFMLGEELKRRGG